MGTSKKTLVSQSSHSQQSWPWWPLLPLYPYGRKRTIFRELIPNKVWCYEQLQGLYYVAVPVRLTVVKVEGGLMIVNPLPPTIELLSSLNQLEKIHGPVLTIVLPTASGLEHKVSLPSLARAFPQASIWVCPGQWSFPVGLPLSWLGIPGKRTKFLLEDGVPHGETCQWLSLGPIDIGLGRFQEVACFHQPSGSLLVTDALIGIESTPPLLFDLDPTPLLFHARDRGDEPLEDSTEARRKGWLRLVLFASYLRPNQLEIPPLSEVITKSFKPGLRSSRAHFGIFPFSWKEGWENSCKELVGDRKALIQIAPVIERLVFPRAQATFVDWLDQISNLPRLRWLISAHFSAPIEFNKNQARRFKDKTYKRSWASNEGNFKFLGGLDKRLLMLGVVPDDPLRVFKD